jgi:D-3-phosphoglycerate dehydrogenase
VGEGSPPVVIIADPIEAGAATRLAQGPCRVLDLSGEPDRLKQELPEAWGLIVRSRTKVTRALLETAPKLKFIARAGVGVDNVDVGAATARGIRIINAPTAATASVAELTIAFLLLLSRRLVPKIVETKGGEWTRGENTGELAGKTVGFVGYGRIAREVARRLQPFGTKCVAYDPYVTRTDDGTELLPLQTLLQRSDFVSLHAALTPENQHLIDAVRLKSMKKGACLVNVARGALVDEKALLEALQEGTIAGAALDVFEVEPPKRKSLLAHPAVIATPHVGAATQEAQSRAGQVVVDETLRALRGEPLEYLVNPGAGS